MPTSNPDKIGKIIRMVMALKPNSILEIGCGFGKWGHLFREYLDIFGKITWEQKDWNTSIDCIEIFEPYINNGTRYYYNNIFIGKAEEIIKSVKNYDIIFMSDVLEHIKKESAIDLLKNIEKRCKKFILNIPLGDNWLHGSDSKNQHEAHISSWTHEELNKLLNIITYETYPSGNKWLGLYLIKGSLDKID